MSATDLVTQGVFWAHVLAAVVLAVSAVVVTRLVAEIDFAPAGIEAAPWARRALDRGAPAGILLFAVAVLGFGFAYLGSKVAELDPPASELGTVESLALTVPGASIGTWSGIAGLVVFNGAIALFLLDLLYRWLRQG